LPRHVLLEVWLMEEGSERDRERGAREGAIQHSDENIARIAPLLHHRIFI